MLDKVTVNGRWDVFLTHRLRVVGFDESLGMGEKVSHWKMYMMPDRSIIVTATVAACDDIWNRRTTSAESSQVE